MDGEGLVVGESTAVRGAHVVGMFAAWLCSVRRAWPPVETNNLAGWVLGERLVCARRRKFCTQIYGAVFQLNHPKGFFYSGMLNHQSGAEKETRAEEETCPWLHAGMWGRVCL